MAALRVPHELLPGLTQHLHLPRAGFESGEQATPLQPKTPFAHRLPIRLAKEQTIFQACSKQNDAATFAAQARQKQFPGGDAE